MPIYLVCPECKKKFPVKKSHKDKRRYCSRGCMSNAYKKTVIGDKNPHWKGGLRPQNCHECGRTVLVIPSKYGKPKLCSSRCLAKSRTAEKSASWNGGCYATRLRHRKTTGTYTGRVKKVRICKKCGLDGVKKGRILHPSCRSNRWFRSLFKCLDCKKERYGVYRLGTQPIRCKSCADTHRSRENNPNWRGGLTSESAKIRKSAQYREWRTAIFIRDRFTCKHCGQIGGKLHADHIIPFCADEAKRFDLDNGRTLCVPCHKKTPTYLKGWATRNAR